MLARTKEVLDLQDASEPENEKLLSNFKSEASSWVGDYRRLVGMSQKSYAETFGELYICMSSPPLLT